MMTMRKTITLTDQQDRWVKGRSAVGGFTDGSACICDQEQNVGFQALEAAIREGIGSGASDKTVPRIMEEAETRLRADGRL